MRTLSPRTRQVLGLLAAVLVAGLLWWAQHDSDPAAPTSGASSTGAAPSRAPATSQVGAGEVALTALPREAQQTVRLIEDGASLPYDRDGSRFRNAEGLLPPQPLGYYREYTVPTPGSRDRGARRIVAGQGGELYYSPDHYRSFRLIVDRNRE